MKRSIALFSICILLLFLLSSCVKPENTSSSQETTYSNKMDISTYMAYFVNFFHEPYKAGDDLSNIDLLHLSLRFCFEQEDRFDFVEIDKDEQIETITGEGMINIAKSLFGEDVDIREYHKFLYNSTDTYAEELDHYIAGYARGYWGGDLYYVNEEVPLEITESETELTVKASIYYAPTLGVMENFRQMEYKFKKVIFEDFLIWQISEINVIE